MARYLSCQERVERRVKALLELISVSNGFNTNVSAVNRRRGAPSDRDSAPEINVWFGDMYNFDSDGNDSVEIRGPMGIAFSTWCPDGESPDAEANFMFADIEKALVNSSMQSTQIFVASGSVGADDIAVDVRPMARATHGFDGDGGQIVCGALVYEVAYRRLRLNPNKFNGADTAVVEP